MTRDLPDEKQRSLAHVVTAIAAYRQTGTAAQLSTLRRAAREAVDHGCSVDEIVIEARSSFSDVLSLLE